MNCEIVWNGDPIVVNSMAYAIARDLAKISGVEVAKMYGLPICVIYGFARVIGIRSHGRRTFEDCYECVVDYLRRVDYTSKSAVRNLVPQARFDEIITLVRTNWPDLYAKITNGRKRSRKTLRQDVVRIALENPGLKLSEVAALAKCSRQYAYSLQEEIRRKRGRMLEKGSRSSPRTH